MFPVLSTVREHSKSDRPLLLLVKHEFPSRMPNYAPMITGEIKNQIDRIWDAFWSGGISNPIEVIEQLAFLLFIKRLDDKQTTDERSANMGGQRVTKPTFPDGTTANNFEYQNLRWSRFKNFDPEMMYDTVANGVFPLIRNLGDDGSTYSHHMRDARFTIPTSALLSRVVDMHPSQLYQQPFTYLHDGGVEGLFSRAESQRHS